MATAAIEDPKVAALRATRSLNPRPQAVTDPEFLGSGFCDARDLVQVTYEMVRRVRDDKVPVAQAAAAFGYSRQAFYDVAAALDEGGPSALVPGKPGPRGARKLVAQVMDHLEALPSPSVAHAVPAHGLLCGLAGSGRQDESPARTQRRSSVDFGA